MKRDGCKVGGNGSKCMDYGDEVGGDRSKWIDNDDKGCVCHGKVDGKDYGVVTDRGN
jgi:hypothetical protein